MSILINRRTKILVQGITTSEGRRYTSSMLEYKAEIVAGVSPGRYGQEVMGVPVYDKVNEAIKRHDIDVSVIFVPKNPAADAAREAIENGIKLVIIVTGGIPVTETLKLKNMARENNAALLGPGSSGILVPGETKAGKIEIEYVLPGSVAVITRTAGRENEIMKSLFKEEIGESVIVSLGGEMIVGTDYVDVLTELKDDPKTQAIVIGGEIGGKMEEDAARFVKDTKYPKPVLAYLFDSDTNPDAANEKINLFSKAGITVVEDIWEIGQLIKESTEE